MDNEADLTSENLILKRSLNFARKVLKPHEFSRLLKESYGTRVIEKRDLALIAIMSVTCMRVGEAVRLQVLDLSANGVQFQGKGDELQLEFPAGDN